MATIVRERPRYDAQGEAVQIVKADSSGHKFELDEDALERLLMREDIRERNVAVISVAGAFRKGKSFLLDFFIRYLDAKYIKQSVENWLGSEDKPLEGFTWRGGSERITAGILMWSEIYKTKTVTGNDLAIILLDTQGTFDSNSTVCECATIFALSTMVSSVQVYNVSQNIQEDDLQHLELFAEYGRIALADSGRVPFQKLLFLVRDWSFPYEADYGEEGGEAILKKRLQIQQNQHSELKFLREHIRSCFSDISCFLMPHPGLTVATNHKFDGKLRDIEPNFIKYIKQLVPLLLSQENLIPKKISGQTIKAKELFLYFKTYSNAFSGSELPEPKSMLVATAEANNLAAVATAKEGYMTVMEQFCGGSTPYMKVGKLEDEHKIQKSKAIDYFVTKRKMGGELLSETYRLQLSEDLDQMFQHYKSHNDSKNVFRAARTPAVFMTLAVITYIMSGMIGIIGLTSIANMLNLITSLAVITLFSWSYIRFTGDNLEISYLIDSAAERLWENLFKQLFILMTKNELEETFTTAIARLDKDGSLLNEPATL